MKTHIAMSASVHTHTLNSGFVEEIEEGTVSHNVHCPGCGGESLQLLLSNRQYSHKCKRCNGLVERMPWSRLGPG